MDGRSRTWRCSITVLGSIPKEKRKRKEKKRKEVVAAAGGVKMALKSERGKKGD